MRPSYEYVQEMTSIRRDGSPKVAQLMDELGLGLYRGEHNAIERLRSAVRRLCIQEKGIERGVPVKLIGVDSDWYIVDEILPGGTVRCRQGFNFSPHVISVVAFSEQLENGDKVRIHR